MKGPGLLWMLQTAAGLPMAGPMFFMGIQYLRTGRTVGGLVFLALGAVALYLPTYLVNRIGGPRSWLRGLVGRGSEKKRDGENGSTDERTASDGDEAESGSPTDARGSAVFDRLRR